MPSGSQTTSHAQRTLILGQLQQVFTLKVELITRYQGPQLN